MPDLGNMTFSEFVPWLVTGAGMVFWATWLLGYLNKLRRPDEGYDEIYSPYMVKMSEWVQDLNSIQMQNLSVAAFFLPLALVYVLVNTIPHEAWVTLEPHATVLVTAVVIYVAQQRAFMRWYR